MEHVSVIPRTGQDAGQRPLRWFVRLLLLAVVVALPAGPGTAQDWKQGRLAHLVPYIGTYDYEAVLTDEAVADALAALAGGEAARIADNLAVRGPIDFIGGHLVLRGLAPHRGGEEEATVWISVYDGTVRAALLHAGRMTLFARDARYEYLPPDLRGFLALPEMRALTQTPPQGLRWVRER